VVLPDGRRTREHEDRLAWLYDRWADIDAWIAANQEP